MRLAKHLVLCIALCSLSWATITDVQHPAGATTSTATCAVTITANGTGATHLLIYKMAHSTSTVTISSISGGGTWTLCGVNCQQGQVTAGAVDAAYLNAPTSSVTTITGTLSASGSGVCWVEEYSTDTSGFTVETISSSNKISDASCTSCAAPTLTIGGTSDVISSASSCGSTCSGTITNWSTIYTSGDGSARRINTTSSAFNWSQSPASTLVSTSLAFKENSGGVAAAGFNKRKKLEKIGI